MLSRYLQFVVLVCALFGVDGCGPGESASAALSDVRLWLVAALVNLWVGVARAGYTLAEEAPIAAVVFGVPAAAALAIWFFLK
jgi:hypothetical protein